MANESDACTTMDSQLLFDDEPKDDKINEDADLANILAK